MAQIGIQQYGDGAQVPVRAGRFGELIFNQGVGEYYELARQGRVFMASMQAGANLGTALTATAVTFTLYNPTGSNVNISLIQCAVTITTEPAAGAGAKANLVYAASPITPDGPIPATNTKLTVRPALLGSNFSGIGIAYSATTLPTTPVVVRVFPFALNNQTAAGDANLAALDFVNGAISLAPNAGVTLQNIGTQTQGIVSMLWAEIPV
jgi:hypothetical protein